MEDNEVNDEEFMEIDDDCNGWDEDEDDDYEQFKEPILANHESNYTPKLTSGFQYNIISEGEVVARRQNIINEVKDVLGLEEDVVQKALIQHRFDKDTVIHNSLESSTKMDTDDAKDSIFDPDAESHLCLVCFCEYPKEEIIIAPCQHFLCKTCFYYYLSTAIKGGPQCVRTVCPITKCNEIISPNLIKKVVTQDDYKMYKKFYLLYFVDCCKAIKWCPAPG